MMAHCPQTPQQEDVTASSRQCSSLPEIVGATVFNKMSTRRVQSVPHCRSKVVTQLQLAVNKDFCVSESQKKENEKTSLCGRNFIGL